MVVNTEKDKPRILRKELIAGMDTIDWNNAAISTINLTGNTSGTHVRFAPLTDIVSAGTILVTADRFETGDAYKPEEWSCVQQGEGEKSKRFLMRNADLGPRYL